MLLCAMRENTVFLTFLKTCINKMFWNRYKNNQSITMFDPLQYQLILVLASNWKVHAAVLTQVLGLVELNIAVAVF